VIVDVGVIVGVGGADVVVEVVGDGDRDVSP